MDWSYRSLFVLCLVCVQGHQAGTNFLFFSFSWLPNWVTEKVFEHDKLEWMLTRHDGMKKLKPKRTQRKVLVLGHIQAFQPGTKISKKEGKKKKEKIFDPKPPTPPNCVNYLNDQCPLFNFAAKLWWSLCLTSTTSLIYLPHTDFPGLESDHVQ